MLMSRCLGLTTQWGVTLFRSLVSKVVGLGMLLLVALITLAGLLLTSSQQVARSFAWVEHTQLVLRAAAEPVDLVRQVESDVRGIVLAGDRPDADELTPLLKRASRDLDDLVRLTRDNPAQHHRAQALQGALQRRVSLLSASVALENGYSAIDSDAAFSKNRTAEARRLMADVDRLRDALIVAERRLLVDRSNNAVQQLKFNKRLLLIGVPLIALLTALVVYLIIQAIRRPTRALEIAMAAMSLGGRAKRLDESTMRSREFTRIASGYNEMISRLEEAAAAQVRNEQALQTLNSELNDRSAALEARNQAIERLSMMAHRMQAARTDGELAEVVCRLLPQILPGMSGAVYAHNNSRNLLMQIATWGAPFDGADRFSPDECWALRLGQGHEQSTAKLDVACKHVNGRPSYHCEPLLAGGEVIGLLYLDQIIPPDLQFRLKAVAQDISSALVNHRLQRDLREQTIRDPLTSLFNRRYLEEALDTEVARSIRSKEPVTVIMCDVDHFKRFNDEFGHDAGDYVLKAIGSTLQAHFRGGDIVCRYGGEEFTVVAPASTHEVMLVRVEKLRASINSMQLRFSGQALGSVSASFGMASLVATAESDGPTLVQAADEALYQAKREGRNRVIVAEQHSLSR